MEMLASSSTGGSSGGLAYKQLWKVNVPSKVRIHAWRLVKGVIPTRAALRRKRVDIADLSCPFCSEMVEDDKHMFKDCVVVGLFWLLGPLKLKPREHRAGSFVAWFWDMLHGLQGEQVELFLLLL